MAIFIQRISDSGGQYRVTVPKLAMKEAGLEKARVVEMWVTEESIIHIKEYNGSKKTKARI